MNRLSHRREQRFWRSLFVVLMVLTCLRIWLGPVESVPRVQAQVQNPAAQRLALISEVRQTNELLAEIVRILSHRTLHVRIEGADNTPSTSGKKRAPRR